MRVFVTGQTGFVGKHVVANLLARGHELVKLTEKPDAMIHLAWAGLPNYESAEHYNNVQWQTELIQIAVDLGVTNITVTGTCLENAVNPPPYAKAKIVLRNNLERMPIELKWVRLYYLFGEGQRPDCLLPSFRRAIGRGDPVFHVVDAEREFVDVKQAARVICHAMEDAFGCIRECRSKPESVKDFCWRHKPPESNIEIIADYPLKEWEK